MTDADVEKVLTLTLETAPVDARRWSTQGPRHVGLSRQTISCIWGVHSAYIRSSKDCPAL